MSRLASACGPRIRSGSLAKLTAMRCASSLVSPCSLLGGTVHRHSRNSRARNVARCALSHAAARSPTSATLAVMRRLIARERRASRYRQAAGICPRPAKSAIGQTPKLCRGSHPTSQRIGRFSIRLLGTEADMSTSTSAASSRAHGPSHWGQLNHVLGEWWQHLRSRSELESLDDSMLRDIGLSRREVGFDVSKHIWTN